MRRWHKLRCGPAARKLQLQRLPFSLSESLTALSLFAFAAGKNKDTEVAEDDICEGVRRVGRFADYLVINLSSPNTKGLRTLQQRDHLRRIILAAQTELGKLEERDALLRGRSEQESEVETSVNLERSYRIKAASFFPTQTARRPLLFVKISV